MLWVNEWQTLDESANGTYALSCHSWIARWRRERAEFYQDISSTGPARCGRERRLERSAALSFRGRGTDAPLHNDAYATLCESMRKPCLARNPTCPQRHQQPVNLSDSMEIDAWLTFKLPASISCPGMTLIKASPTWGVHLGSGPSSRSLLRSRRRQTLSTPKSQEIVAISVSSTVLTGNTSGPTLTENGTIICSHSRSAARLPCWGCGAQVAPHPYAKLFLGCVAIRRQAHVNCDEIGCQLAKHS